VSPCQNSQPQTEAAAQRIRTIIALVRGEKDSEVYTSLILAPNGPAIAAPPLFVHPQKDNLHFLNIRWKLQEPLKIIFS